MSVSKVIEILAHSSESFEDAAQQAVDEAAKSVKHINNVWIIDQSCKVENNKISEYWVKTKISFLVEH
jgi:hypothetical protein